MQRTLALGAAWTASAAAAVGLGFLAVSLVDASASPATQPQGATGTTSGSTPPSATPTGTPVVTSGQMATVGGTVFADCASGTPVVAGVPAAGWWADDSPKPGEAEFENGSLKVEVYVTCAGGAPMFRMVGLREDGGGSSPSSWPSSTGAPDDSDGRGGNSGHGSDDSGGGDSSGRGRGGGGSGEG